MTFDTQIAQGLDREASVLKFLDHPMFLKVYDGAREGQFLDEIGQVFPVVFMVSELIKNGELFDFVLNKKNKEQIKETVVRRYAKQLIEAI